MNTNYRNIGIALVGLLLSASAIAHHSFAAQYDADKPINLSGLITKVEWQNPHVYFYMDVADASGNYQKWALEMGAPAVLTRTLGWTRSTLNIGDTVSVEGRQARDGSHLANARDVTLASGEKLGAGSSQSVTP